MMGAGHEHKGLAVQYLLRERRLGAVCRRDPVAAERDVEIAIVRINRSSVASANDNDADGARRINSCTEWAISGSGIVTTAPTRTCPAVPDASALTSRRASSIWRNTSRPHDTIT
jgi:hypothetical protein